MPRFTCRFYSQTKNHRPYNIVNYESGMAEQINFKKFALPGKLRNRNYENKVTSLNPGAEGFFNSGINPLLFPLAREKPLLAETVGDKKMLIMDLMSNVVDKNYKEV